MSDKHYALLGADDQYIASVWATKVTPKDDPTEGFFFYFGSAIVCAYGGAYRETDTSRVTRPVAKQGEAA